VSEAYYRLRQNGAAASMSFALGMAGSGSLTLALDDGAPVLDPSIANLNVFSILSTPAAGTFSWYIDGAPVQSGAQSALNIGSSGPAGALTEGVHELICGFQGGGGTSAIAYASTLILSRLDASASLAVFRVRSLTEAPLQFYGGGFSINQGSDTLEIETRVPDTGTLAYAWSLNGSAISGATAAAIQVGAAGPAGALNAGSYDLSCRVTSSSGASYSGSLSLIVKTAPLAPSPSPSASAGLTLSANLPSGEASLSDATPLFILGNGFDTRNVIANCPLASNYSWFVDGISVKSSADNWYLAGPFSSAGTHQLDCLVLTTGNFFYSASVFIYAL
jgi:hypothetical protein